MKRRLDAVAARPSRERAATVFATASFNAVEAAAADGRARVQALRAGRLLAEDDAAALPDGLAMGGVRERHSQNCRSELEALGWWTRGADGNPCVLGDFVSA